MEQNLPNGRLLTSLRFSVLKGKREREELKADRSVFGDIGRTAGSD
jgi:hypothetical protein